MIKKRNINILVYMILIIGIISLHTGVQSTAKYHTNGTLKYNVNYKQISTINNDVSGTRLLANSQGFDYEFKFNRSNNMISGDSNDIYKIEFVEQNNLTCNVTSISSGGNTSENSNIIFNEIGEEQITARIHCNLNDNLKDSDNLTLKVKVQEYFNDNDSVSYDYLTSTLAPMTAEAYYSKYPKKPTGVSADNKEFTIAKTESNSNIKTKLLEWLKYFSTVDSQILNNKIFYQDIVNYIDKYWPVATSAGYKSIPGIAFEDLNDNYIFTIEKTFASYVKTELDYTEAHQFDFIDIDMSDKNLIYTMFIHYLGEYCYKSDTTEFSVLKEYIDERVNIYGDIISWIEKGNALGITYSNNVINIPSKLYENLITTNDSFNIEVSKDSSKGDLMDAIAPSLLENFSFIDISIRYRIVYQNENDYTTPSYIINKIYDGRSKDINIYSLYINADGTEKVLVHAYNNSSDLSDVTLELNKINNNQFDLAYDLSTSSDKINDDINSIRENVNSIYDVISSEVTTETEKIVTITLTEKTATANEEENIVIDNNNIESDTSILPDTNQDNIEKPETIVIGDSETPPIIDEDAKNVENITTSDTESDDNADITISTPDIEITAPDDQSDNIEAPQQNSQAQSDNTINVNDSSNNIDDENKVNSEN